MGNICRSPTAEVVMRARLVGAGLSDRVVVDSAGTGGWHVGRGADERALDMLHANGYGGDDHVARQFDPGWFDDRDLIVAMDAENLRALHRAALPDQQAKIVLLRSFDPASTADLDVPDPYYGGPGGFEDVLALVEAACDGLVDYLRSELM
jgi:protein-tyrosine phosphatase